MTCLLADYYDFEEHLEAHSHNGGRLGELTPHQLSQGSSVFQGTRPEGQHDLRHHPLSAIRALQEGRPHIQSG